jgi:ATP-dependent DNA helicase RecG
MITKDEVIALMKNRESDRIERTTSFREDKLGPAVCYLSNDLADHKKPGYVLLGVNDDGSGANMKITDKDLQKIGAVKSNGNVQPLPSMMVSEIFDVDGSDVVAVAVHPSLYPPVRYRGRCYIRVGPRKDLANEAEERRLSEKRASSAKSFDARPCAGAGLDDLNIDLFTLVYLRQAVDQHVIAANNRTRIEQLASLRMYDLSFNVPTHAGLLVLGVNPLFFLPGAYIQYVRFEGPDMTTKVDYEKPFSGALITELKNLEDFLKVNIIKERPVREKSLQESIIFNYPFWALRELALNAVMHRDYESHAPIYIYEFSNRIEIQNPGGLFGDVRPENFPNTSDYRNPVLAEALKTLGYVNRFNFGIRNAQHELELNGNGKAEFQINLKTKFQVSIPINKKW